jgi:hypothetical protein
MRTRVPAIQTQSKDVPFLGKVFRGYKKNERLHTFDQSYVVDHRNEQAAIPFRRGFAFTGRGFLPDLFASHAPVTLVEASATTLEDEGVHGREGMMPPSGHLSRLQPGQNVDEGSGGAGSFCTVPAYGAKVNG